MLAMALFEIFGIFTLSLYRIECSYFQPIYVYTIDKT